MRSGTRKRPWARGLRRGCETVESLLILHQDGGLPPREVVALKRHLRGCARCRARERLLEGLLAAVRNAPLPEPNEPYWERMARQIMARILANPPPWLEDEARPDAAP